MKKDMLMILVSVVIGIVVVALAKPENPVPIAVGAMGVAFASIACAREQVIPWMKKKKAG